MDLPTPTARYLQRGDAASLEAFRCSRGPWFEDEVERFVTTQLFAQHAWRVGQTDHTVIVLELAEVGIVALGAHEEDDTAAGGRPLTSSLWIVAAVAVEYQSATLPGIAPYDGARRVTLGRHLAETMLSDIAGTERAPVVRAIVARDNVRSLALCARVGLTHELPDADERYIQRLGNIG